MKLFSTLLVLCVLFSCSKDSIDETEVRESGVVTGNIKAYDRFGSVNSSNNDIAVKLIDKDNKVFSTPVNANGTFRFENVAFGNVTLFSTKPGYGFTDSLSFNHQKVIDSLTDIFLVEELPFSLRLNGISYSNSTLHLSTTYNYQTTDSYLVAEIFCFSKDPNVSINHNSLFMIPGGQIGVQALTIVTTVGVGVPLKTFTDAGFKTGDKIYVSIIPSISKLFQLYHDQGRNYNILHYKIGNASNTASFTLN